MQKKRIINQTVIPYEICIDLVLQNLDELGELDNHTNFCDLLSRTLLYFQLFLCVIYNSV